MTKQEFAALQIGDKIRHPYIGGNEPMTIVQKDFGHLTVAIFATATNPTEWEVWSTSIEHTFRFPATGEETNEP